MKKWIRKHLLAHVLSFIRTADEQELHDIMASVEQRYRLAHPNWEIVYFALPKQPSQERSSILQAALSYLNNPKSQQSQQ